MVQLPRDAAELGGQKQGVAPEPITPGMFGYSLLRMNHNREFMNALMDEMLAFGVPIEGLHTETGPGVYEVAIAFGEALEQADRAILFKTGAKEIGARFGDHAELHGQVEPEVPGLQRPHPPEPVEGQDGKTNLFYDATSPRRMSKLFESYLAGQVALPDGDSRRCSGRPSTATSAWSTASGRRVKPTWGMDNRTASFRVIAGSPKATRLETRCPGADVNPYLAMAAVIAAGLHGVEKGLKLGAADHRHQRRRRRRAARAAHADRDDAHLPAARRSRATGSATLSSTTSRRPATGSGASGSTA